jgi:hypothetical protein
MVWILEGRRRIANGSGKFKNEPEQTWNPSIRWMKEDKLRNTDSSF